MKDLTKTEAVLMLQILSTKELVSMQKDFALIQVGNTPVMVEQVGKEDLEFFLPVFEMLGYKLNERQIQHISFLGLSAQIFELEDKVEKNFIQMKPDIKTIVAGGWAMD